MKDVLDSSVALKTVLDENDSEKAKRLIDEYRRGIHELLAPEIFPAEVGHALARAERKGIVPLGNGLGLYVNVLSDCPRILSTTPLLPQAFALASQLRVSFYDCLYVLLAEQEHCEFITADSKLIAALQGHPLTSLSELQF